MNDIAETIDYKGYSIEIRYDEDAGNPIKEFDELLTVVLHEKAERNFGWTSDQHYADLLNHGLEEILERGYTRTLHGERGALAVVVRWLKAFHGVTVALPIGAHVHSGTSVYLGAGPAAFDGGGWDSGWIGLIIDTPERRKVMGFEPGNGTNPNGDAWDSPEAIEWGLRGDFETFQYWVAGEVYGYVVKDPDGDELQDGSCWGYYGGREWAEEGDGEGYMITECKSIIDADLLRKAIAAAEIEAHAFNDHIALYRKAVNAR